MLIDKAFSLWTREKLITHKIIETEIEIICLFTVYLFIYSQIKAIT